LSEIWSVNIKFLTNILPGYTFHYDLPHTHTHMQTFNGLFSRTTWVGQYQKDKSFWILLKQEMMGCSGLS